MCRPKAKRYKVQWRLQPQLAELAGAAWFAGTDLAFRALPEYELREADVAVVSKERWEAVDPDGYLQGAGTGDRGTLAF